MGLGLLESKRVRVGGDSDTVDGVRLPLGDKDGDRERECEAVGVRDGGEGVGLGDGGVPEREVVCDSVTVVCVRLALALAEGLALADEVRDAVRVVCEAETADAVALPESEALRDRVAVEEGDWGVGVTVEVQERLSGGERLVVRVRLCERLGVQLGLGGCVTVGGDRELLGVAVGLALVVAVQERDGDGDLDHERLQVTDSTLVSVSDVLTEGVVETEPVRLAVTEVWVGDAVRVDAEREREQVRVVDRLRRRVSVAVKVTVGGVAEVLRLGVGVGEPENEGVQMAVAVAEAEAEKVREWLGVGVRLMVVRLSDGGVWVTLPEGLSDAVGDRVCGALTESVGVWEAEGGLWVKVAVLWE